MVLGQDKQEGKISSPTCLMREVYVVQLIRQLNWNIVVGQGIKILGSH